MRTYAYVILIVLLSIIILQPFFEMLNVFTEKARVDSAVLNAGRLAAARSVEDYNRAELNPEIDADSFIDIFSEAFASAMDMKVVSVSSDRAYFSPADGADERFNGFEARLAIDEEYGKVSLCRINVSGRYRYKTQILRYAQQQLPGLTAFDLNAAQVFEVRVVN
ncbi:hypothetical protein DFR58_10517 [Anaerobacterium chartisolvens]|uniref:Flp pilus-assembly TadE/G-like protein n=1 Tax=Anaerobacterium chartisolvens TaxID=1297424 RepID=A0A369B9P8_9FIRM|nr:hypothetical protein [Anaerobacterium chartisolvens]RCX18259.1 hypothetical protein DFR58_10517 [Anaerobacterium chartisolvens]